MRLHTIRLQTCFAFVALLFLTAANVRAQEGGQEYTSLEGVASVKAVWDFRVGDPKTALAHLGLIHDMLDDPNLQKGGERPEFVLVFLGPAVKFISTEENEAPSQTERKIAEKISAMEADGIRLEICMTAAHAQDISPESILPEIIQVGNGWISLIGYQHQGYATISNF